MGKIENGIEFVTIEEMAETVERYILKKKGIRVKINLKNPSIHSGIDFLKLNHAYTIAKQNEQT